jgi:hypothetical protein
MRKGSKSFSFFHPVLSVLFCSSCSACPVLPVLSWILVLVYPFLDCVSVCVCVCVCLFTHARLPHTPISAEGNWECENSSAGTRKREGKSAKAKARNLRPKKSAKAQARKYTSQALKRKHEARFEFV